MYAREDGTFSGEALVVYFKEDSVLLALNILDDAELRLGDSGTVMRVQRAEFGHKNTGGDAHGHNAKPRKTVDKKKATRRIGKMQKCVDKPFTFAWSLSDAQLGNCRNGTMKMDSDPQWHPRIVTMLSIKTVEWWSSNICSH